MVPTGAPVCLPRRRQVRRYLQPIHRPVWAASRRPNRPPDCLRCLWRANVDTVCVLGRTFLVCAFAHALPLAGTADRVMLCSSLPASRTHSAHRHSQLLTEWTGRRGHADEYLTSLVRLLRASFTPRAPPVCALAARARDARRRVEKRRRRSGGVLVFQAWL